MKYTVDMTKGSEFKHIIKFAFPLLVGNIFQQMYNVVDSAIVGRYLGSRALAAVGATGSITFFFYTLCIGLATGAGILISQCFGAGDEKSVKNYIINSAYVLGIFGIVISIISTIGAPYLLRLLNTPQSIIGMSASYMRIACMGTIAVAAYNWINGVMRSLGDSRTPLVFLIIASAVNTVLDLLFVMVFKMGVCGAALATVMAQGISAAGSIAFAFRKNIFFKFSSDNLKMRKQHISACLKMGVPIALQNAMVSVSMIFLQKTANHFGDTVIAAYTATMRVEQFIQQPFSSLNMAVSSFAGQNLGAGKSERVIKGYKKSLAASLVLALCVMGVFMLAANGIIHIFVNNESVIEIGGYALRISACFYVFLGVIHVTRGLLNGIGDANYAMINGLAEVSGRIGFALLFVNVLSMDYKAIWLTTCFTWLLTAILSVIRYFAIRKKKIYNRGLH